MKTLLTILIAILFVGVSYGSTEVDRWPNNGAKHKTHFKSSNTGFNYKKHYKKRKRARRKHKPCPMLSDIR
jgi:hypothetical protein